MIVTYPVVAGQAPRFSVLSAVPAWRSMSLELVRQPTPVDCAERAAHARHVRRPAWADFPGRAAAGKSAA